MKGSYCSQNVEGEDIIVGGHLRGKEISLLLVVLAGRHLREPDPDHSSSPPFSPLVDSR
jgi:hypothetical protein